jgi:hypothetical protein
MNKGKEFDKQSTDINELKWRFGQQKWAPHQNYKCGAHF